MSQYDYSKEKRRRRAFKRIRGVILLLLVLGLLIGCLLFHVMRMYYY